MRAKIRKGKRVVKRSAKVKDQKVVTVVPVLTSSPVSQVLQKKEASVLQEKKNDVSTGMEVAVVVSNILVPHQDDKAIQLCLMHIKDLDVSTIFFDGDMIDYYNRSDIDRNPLRIFTQKEISTLRSEIEARIRKQESDDQSKEDALAKKDERKPRHLKALSTDQLERFTKREIMELALKKELSQLFGIFKLFRDARPNADLIWIYGCQEFYLLKYLEKYYSHLIDQVDQFCRQNKIQKVYNGTRNNTYNYGQLTIGHWFRGGLNSPSAFVAHSLMDDEGVSLIQGHTKRGGFACRTVAGPKFLSAYENFSLCKRPTGKNWQLGYSLIYREKDKKRFQVFQVPVASYGFVWGDKEYRLDPTKVGSWEKSVAISDIHIPYENKGSLDALFPFLKEFQPDNIFVDGDVNDFEDISRFAKSPIDVLTDDDVNDIQSLIVENGQTHSGRRFIKPRLQREFEKIRKFFKRLRETCPKAKIYWIYGNHEYRLQRYVEENAGQLAGVCRPGDKEEILSLADITKVKELGVEVVYSGLIQSQMTYGSLLIGHFYVVCANSAYTARNLLKRKHQSLLQPHVHRIGGHYKTSLDGKMLVAVEMGCMCRLDPQYMQDPNWQNGFVVIHKKKNSDRFYLQPIQIVDDAFLFGGKRYGRPSNNTSSTSGGNSAIAKTS